MSKKLWIPHGTIPAVTTPFKADDSVNYEELKRYLDYLIDAGVHCVLVLGSTGEYTTMSMEERKSVMKVAVEHVNHRIPVMLGCTTHYLATTLELTKYAEELGADTVLILPPHYLGSTSEGIYQYFKTIAEACPNIGIDIYHNPMSTNTLLQPEEIARLARIPNIVSVKNTIDMEHTIKTLIACEGIENFSVQTAMECEILPHVAQGGAGGTGIISGLIPKECVKIYDLMVKDNDYKAACALNEKVRKLYFYVEEEPNPAPVKAALNMLGFDWGNPRLPVPECSDALKAKIRAALLELGYDATH